MKFKKSVFTEYIKLLYRFSKQKIRNFEMKMNPNIYKTLISYERLGETENPNRDLYELALSDYARIVYSSAFRRLQSKTQVFALAPNAALRSRLTHSMEVASVGRWIAQDVVKRINGLDPNFAIAIPLLVETACLAHDIGNPPFGHFGEDVIKEWFKYYGKKTLEKSIGEGIANSHQANILLDDFYNFDGNPQTIRVLTRLQGRTSEERVKKGMNLTCTQILTCLKYPKNPSDNDLLWKKAGYFHSESDIIEACWEKISGTGSQRRFPLSYIVEAADDISYCLSDLEDGIDERLITANQIFDALDVWLSSPTESELMDKLRNILRGLKIKLEKNKENSRDLYIVFKTSCTATLIKRASDLYIERHQEILQGKTWSLFKEDGDEMRLLESLKAIASSKIYPSDPVEIPFISGRSVINKILDDYRPLLELQLEDFNKLLIASNTGDRSGIKHLGFSMGLPLFNRLPKNYIEIYEAHVKKTPSKYDNRLWEWFNRTHLIVDYLSGMADDYALRFYKKLSGEFYYYD
jgi:dGTPase